MREKKPDNLSIRRREIYMTALLSEKTKKSWSSYAFSQPVFCKTHPRNIR